MSSPTESCKDIRLLESPPYESSVEQEMELIQAMLAATSQGETTSSSAEDRTSRYLEEFSKLRSKAEEFIQYMMRVNRSLKRELNASRRQNMELEDLVSKLEREMQQLSIENRTRKDQLSSHKLDIETQNRLQLENLALRQELLSKEILLSSPSTSSSTSSKKHHAINSIEQALPSSSSSSSSSSALIASPISRLRMALEPPSVSASSSSHAKTLNNGDHNILGMVKKEREITVD